MEVNELTDIIASKYHGLDISVYGVFWEERAQYDLCDLLNREEKLTEEERYEIAKKFAKMCIDIQNLVEHNCYYIGRIEKYIKSFNLKKEKKYLKMLASEFKDSKNLKNIKDDQKQRNRNLVYHLVDNILEKIIKEESCFCPENENEVSLKDLEDQPCQRNSCLFGNVDRLFPVFKKKQLEDMCYELNRLNLSKEKKIYLAKKFGHIICVGSNFLDLEHYNLYKKDFENNHASQVSKQEWEGLLKSLNKVESNIFKKFVEIITECDYGDDFNCEECRIKKACSKGYLMLADSLKNKTNGKKNVYQKECSFEKQ